MGAFSPAPDHIAVSAQARINDAIIRLMTEGTLHSRYLPLIDQCLDQEEARRDRYEASRAPNFIDLLTLAVVGADRPETFYRARRLHRQLTEALVRHRRD